MNITTNESIMDLIKEHAVKSVVIEHSYDNSWSELYHTLSTDSPPIPHP